MDHFQQENTQSLTQHSNLSESKKDLTTQKMQIFIGDQYSKYYQSKFDQITPKKQMAGFNIAAFFLGVIWLFYRKMYLYGFIYLAFMIFVAVMGIAFEIPESLDRGISMGLAATMGLGGNSLYKFFVEKKITQIEKIQCAEETAELEKQGGTNIWAALILLIIVITFISFGIWLET